MNTKALDKNGLAWAKQSFDKEDNVEVKRAWAQCLTQLPQTELENFSRSLTLSVHSKIQRLGQFFDGLLNDKTYGLDQVHSIFKEGREDILLNRIFAVEVLSKAKDSEVKTALLDYLSRGTVKVSRPLLRDRLRDIERRIKIELGGKQLGLNL